MATILSIFVKRSKTNDDFINIVSIFCFYYSMRNDLCSSLYGLIKYIEHKIAISPTYLKIKLISLFWITVEVGITTLLGTLDIKTNADTWKPY